MVREPEYTNFSLQSLKVTTCLLLLLYFLPNAWVLEIIWLYSVRILIGYFEFEWIELILAIICFTLSICKSYFRARPSNFSQFIKLSQKLYRKLLKGRWSKKVLAWRWEELAKLYVYICWSYGIYSELRRVYIWQLAALIGCSDSPLLPHSALSWNFSPAENLANLSLQDGATTWHYYWSNPPSVRPSIRPTGSKL